MSMRVILDSLKNIFFFTNWLRTR